MYSIVMNVFDSVHLRNIRFSATFFLSFSYLRFSVLSLFLPQANLPRNTEKERTYLSIWLLFFWLPFVPPFFFLTVSSFPSLLLCFFLIPSFCCSPISSFVSFWCLLQFFPVFISEPFCFCLLKQLYNAAARNEN